MKNIILFILFVSILNSCNSDFLPKPRPYLKLEYPKPSYSKLNSDCPYTFEASDLATVNFKDNCWSTIVYPHLKATVHITYRSLDNNLDEILKETEKLTYEHVIKADAINMVPYENFEKKVFGKLFNVEGNVATNVQFQVTDSTKHVLAGALYFYTKPNYDSILPAIKYVEKDIIHLVETLEWK